MSVDGLFKVKDGVLKLNNFEFLAKKADVILKDNDVIIKNSHVIHKDMIDANLDLKIDTKKNHLQKVMQRLTLLGLKVMVIQL